MASAAARGRISSSFVFGRRLLLRTCSSRLVEAQTPCKVSPETSLFHPLVTRDHVRTSSTARHLCTIALDPDFYKIPHEEGIPEGAKLKLYNLPPTEDREKLKNDLIEWFVTCEHQDEPVTVLNFEYTDDPEWNAKGVGAFVEFGSRWQAVTVYARRDASKFQGRYVRMNFVERKPFPPEWLAKNAKWFRKDFTNNWKIFVGNLAWSVDDEKLRNAFAEHGTVYDAKVMTDKETGRSRGFGFVTMSSKEEMEKAIQTLNGKPLDGRLLRVNDASQKPGSSTGNAGNADAVPNPAAAQQ